MLSEQKKRTELLISLRILQRIDPPVVESMRAYERRIRRLTRELVERNPALIDKDNLLRELEQAAAMPEDDREAIRRTIECW